MQFGDPTPARQSPAATLNPAPEDSVIAGASPASGSVSGRVLAQLRTSRASDLLLSWADRYRRWIFAGLALLYVAGFNAQWRLEPDSALYLTIGRNLAERKGYTFHGKSHRLAYP